MTTTLWFIELAWLSGKHRKSWKLVNQIIDNDYRRRGAMSMKTYNFKMSCWYGN